MSGTSGGWPVFGADVARTGHAPHTHGPKANPTECWQFEPATSYESSPVVVGDTLYVGSMEGEVHALYATSGMERWQFDTRERVKSHPAVVDETVYVGTSGGVADDGGLYAIESTPASGRHRWSFESVVDGGDFPGGPAVDGDTVYASDGNANLYAVDRSSGDCEWYNHDFGADAAPAIDRGTVYVNTGSAVAALDAGGASGVPLVRDGRSGDYPDDPRWTYEDVGSTSRPSAPAVADGSVYVGAGDGQLHALDAGTGRREWTYATGDAIRSSPAVADGTVYVGSRDGHVHAVDAARGRREWRFDAADEVNSSPAVADGVVYVGSDDDGFGGPDGHLYALDASDGTELWSFEVGEVRRCSPAVHDGTVYIGGGDGVYAIEEGDGPDAPGTADDLVRSDDDARGPTGTACPNCDTGLDEYGDVNFCPHCGADLS